MRNNIVHSGADELTYEIRGIVAVAQQLEKMGVEMTWENIGDPIAKKHEVPLWIKEIVKEAVMENETYGYSPTKGLLATREFIAEQRNKENGLPKLTPENILFFNGLGDAISIIYTYLNTGARVIGPSPAYPTHSSAEAAHAVTKHITYNLNPHRNWLPDLEELRNKVKFNPTISGILIINPDNPTGMVYPEKILKEIVSIAKEFDLFIICDETYANISYGQEKMVPLHKVISDVPAIIMRGLSKEIPWPGSRCGWIEVYNNDKDPVFARYTKTLVDAKMLEVCATTLPQQVLPKIFSDERYESHLKETAKKFNKKADIAYDIFRDTLGIISPKAEGAFYVSVVFDDGVLNNKQTLKIKNKQAKKLIEDLTQTVSLDKRFVYYLMSSTGICVVPLSGFNSNLLGFRMTLLEPNEEKFRQTTETISIAIKNYLKST